VTLVAVAGLGGGPRVAGADEARPVHGPFEEAGRAVDQATGNLRSLGVELAQQLERWRGWMGGPGGMRGEPGSPAERPLITMMLHHRGELGLSAEQVSRLETLRGDFTREAIRRDADLRIAELDLQGLLAQDPVDLPKVEAKIREVAQLRADLRIGRLRTLEQGKAVLTPEQRTRLQGLMSAAPSRGAGPGGMPGPRRTAEAGRQI